MVSDSIVKLKLTSLFLFSFLHFSSSFDIGPYYFYIFSADGRGKENLLYANSTKNTNKRNPNRKAQNISTPVKRPPVEHVTAEKHLDSPKLQVHSNHANSL